jgi:hypothetical protein
MRYNVFASPAVLLLARRSPLPVTFAFLPGGAPGEQNHHVWAEAAIARQ